jgi:hypothetical protein
MIKRGFVVHFELTNVNTSVVTARSTIPRERRNPILFHAKGYTSKVFLKNV